MKKGDFFIIGIIIVLLLIPVIFLFVNRNDKGKVCVYYMNELYGEYPLDVDATYDIVTDLGSNTICIEDSKVSMVHADCPDKICVSHNSIRYNHEEIICLPHKIIVSIESDLDNEGEYDAITR